MLSRRFLILVLLSLGAAWLFAHFIKETIVDIARVSNESMLPYLKPGQRVVFSRFAPCLHLPGAKVGFACRPCEAGRAYVFRHPHKKNLRLVKFAVPFAEAMPSLRRDIMWFTDGKPNRVETDVPLPMPMDAHNACFFVGSNTDVSVDSRQFGPVPLELVEGEVLWPALQLQAHAIKHNAK
ncbi:S26 family signal peptidase [Turneriella parva]|jgi:signal peptidase I|uniref:Peptidase S26 domain-containing protein n=1 Tax=Turneriella parva (strain ATCC BAA-1111 / DSM 21527 / NCTC 11395 / H) TaxID=869212 RepID=I4BBU4_TURPD|nr:S26 family signal peptidase [Turneriella parva]AFM14751.1 hypothetical protein Turpa_4118 [Turneriella parva DSM 21527]